MLVEMILGNMNYINLEDRKIDRVFIDWYEVNKKVLKLRSEAGKNIGIRLSKDSGLKYGDILVLAENEAVVVDIKYSEAIMIKAEDMESMGRICYEIGNKHIPIFIEHDTIRVAYDEPLFVLLEKKGFNPKKVKAKLVNGIEGHHHEH